MSKCNVYLGVPLGGASLTLGTHRSILDTTRCRHVVTLEHQSSSILPFTFNLLWCQALNQRHQLGLTHFILLHSDVSPQEGWIDKIVDLLDETGLDVLSAVIPIKSTHGPAAGLTSTAVDTDPWRPRRITMAEFSKHPTKGVLNNEFFRERYNANLLLNTGLMCVRLDQEWSTDVCFDFRHRTVLDESGQYHPQVEPEDWRFARWCHARGLNIGVTQEIELAHEGSAPFYNRGTWGHVVDPANIMYVEQNRVSPVVQTAGGKGATDAC